MEMEFTRSVGTSKWLDMFRGTNLRRTEITVMVWLLQQMSGVIFAGNVVFVFEQAGISQQAAFDLGLGTSAIQLFSNFINMVLMFFLGRRTIYLVGFIYSAVNLVVVGVTSIYGDRGSLSARWVQAGFQMVGHVRRGQSSPPLNPHIYKYSYCIKRGSRHRLSAETYNRRSWSDTLGSSDHRATPSWARHLPPGCGTRPLPSPGWSTL